MVTEARGEEAVKAVRPGDVRRRGRREGARRRGGGGEALKRGGINEAETTRRRQRDRDGEAEAARRRGGEARWKVVWRTAETVNGTELRDSRRRRGSSMSSRVFTSSAHSQLQWPSSSRRLRLRRQRAER